ncbi:MAG: enoyl-CoA hydratase/isomerase family protein [Myxococcota bacterium]
MEGWQHLRITAEDDGQTWLLELDHGKANEIGTEVLREVERLAAALAADPRVRSLITFSRRRTSKGTPIFVAGANVTERVGWDDERVLAHVGWQRQVLAQLRAAPVFHAVVVSGVALGWGTEFLLTADHRIGCDGAVFGLPETGLGIVPGAGGTGELWAEIGVGHALRLGMTGERIGPAEALRIGLVHEQRDTLDAGLARARELAAMVARRSPTAVAAFKRGVLAAVGGTAAERTAAEDTAYALCVRRGEAAIGRSSFETIAAGGTPAWGPRAS